EAVEAGARVLLERGLRPEGGTRHLLAPSGEPADERRDLYDTAFVLFALAEAAQALGNRPDLIEAAETLLRWTEDNWSHESGGFYEGEIVTTPPRRQNPHMHMFEALLALHEATGKREHLGGASSIADLFRIKLFDARHGSLGEYYNDEWYPLEGEDGEIVEPGHHFEWSWLLHRWNSFGGGDLSAIAEKLRIHAEIYGVHPQTRAVYDEVFADGRPRTTSSRLWPHTERIKANVVRFERTRDPNAAQAALQAFDVLMRYCETPTKGLWRDSLEPDGRFIEEAAPASSFYHVMFAMWELIRVADALD
ncbi:MAG: AGE family epimerase/isomerase, partial [Phycisphaerales bacterium]|nr:AGE family epimerase/isomerase [Hyphomonadaceae bacterium]